MKYLDLVEMKSCGIYSVELPKKKLLSILGNAEPCELPGATISIIENPITALKANRFGSGVFFSTQVKYKNITGGMLENALSEMDRPDYEKAVDALVTTTPYTVELFNVFYNSETNILVINSRSRRSMFVLAYLVELFDRVGIKSLIVSEKLSLQTRLESHLCDGVALFNHMVFDNALTLHKQIEGKRETVHIADADTSKDEVLEMLKNGYLVKNLKMKFADEMAFDFDNNLRVKNVKFKFLSELKEEIADGNEWAFKRCVERQFVCLNAVINNMILDFSENSELENFLTGDKQ